LSYFRSKHLLAAKALAAKDWSHPKVLLVARHMAKDGKSTEEIRIALWPDVTHGCALKRLKKFNIRPFAWSKRAHRGFETTEPTFAKAGVVDFRSYHPREVAK
jgi:hypothetical protein